MALFGFGHKRNDPDEQEPGEEIDDGSWAIDPMNELQDKWRSGKITDQEYDDAVDTTLEQNGLDEEEKR